VTELLEVITADDVAHDLDECIRRGTSDLSGIFSTPDKRGRNLVVAGEHGELHVVSKKYTSNVIVLTLWVRGANPDGSLPEEGQEQFVENLRELTSWFTVDELVTLRYTIDGDAREIVGEVIASIEPKLDGFGRYRSASIKIALNCASPFWADVEPSEQTITLSTNATATLTEFAGATAPMEDLLVVFEQQNNPRLMQDSSGVFVALDRVITSGQTITVDTSAFEVYGSVGVAGGLYEDLSYGGRGTSRWFALMPEPGGGAPIVRLLHTGGGSRSVTVTGKRKYKIA
jgi:hypothetical protein